eukprot:UN11241
MTTGIIFYLLSIARVYGALSDDYPQWPSPSNWEGTFSIPALKASGIMQFCYDAENELFTKNFTYNMYQGKATQFSLGLIFIDATEYVLCYGPSDCSAHNLSPGECSKYPLTQFPFGYGQFKDYTNVGVVSVYNDAVNEIKQVSHYVGDIIGYPTGRFATAQYFDDTNSSDPIGNIYIDELKWYTEIRWVDQIKSGVDTDCFKLLPSC